MFESRDEARGGVGALGLGLGLGLGEGKRDVIGAAARWGVRKL